MANQLITDSEQLNKQLSYAKKQLAAGTDLDLVVGSAFVESMRNTYYRHTGTALDEIIDNSIEAGAANVHITFEFGGGSENKPTSLAVIDDGHGMPPEMIQFAVRWGGTHREGSREGFGRFGFGLPSASVNQARRFVVYSIIEGGRWHGVEFDLDEIASGKYNDPSTGRVLAPSTQKISPPKWVMSYIEANFGKENFTHGTVVLWGGTEKKLDRLTWKTISALQKHLLSHFGVTYRNYLTRTRLVFNGTRVEPTDPLFITPGLRFYDSDEDRAEALDASEIEVLDKRTGLKVKMRIRYARYPLSFFAIDKKKAAGKGNQNERWLVKNANHGIVICRMGRQIDVLTQTPWSTLEKFGNDARYWGVELDFPSELDEEFTISNSKQGVVMSDRLWDLLRDAGMEKALRDLKGWVGKEQNKNRVEPERDDVKRVSEQSMEESLRFKPKRAGEDSVERIKKAKENLEQWAKRTAKEEKKPIDDVLQEHEEETAKHPYRVKFEDLPGAPFFRVEQLGGMKVLYINRDHRFYSDIYAATGSPRNVRAGLEVLLFVIGDCELDAQGNPDRKMFYASEKQEWSQLLNTALGSLSKFVHETDVDDGEVAEVDPKARAAE